MSTTPSSRLPHSLTHLWQRFRSERALSWAGIWLFSCSCSFNNSFQDGCIGSVKVTVPPPNKGGQWTVERDSSPGKEKAPVTFAAYAAPTHNLGWLAFAKNALSSKEQNTKPTTEGLWWEYPALQKLMSISYSSEDFDQVSKHDPKPRVPLEYVPMVLSTEPEDLWKERPEQVRICFHTSLSNRGWGHYHVPRNTDRLKQLCHSGHAMGRGNYWYVLDDTYATSGIACRMFFSPARLYIVAQCGQTVYRTLIRRHASCLQTSKGCEIASAILQKLPAGSRQRVELPRQEQAQ